MNAQHSSSDFFVSVLHPISHHPTDSGRSAPRIGKGSRNRIDPREIDRKTDAGSNARASDFTRYGFFHVHSPYPLFTRSREALSLSALRAIAITSATSAALTSVASRPILAPQDGEVMTPGWLC